jgi:magnesium-transporting ATPase (P-type)
VPPTCHNKRRSYRGLSQNEPFLISGTPVTEGVGRMLVVAVGAHSQKGKIKALLQKEQEVPCPPPP